MNKIEKRESNFSYAEMHVLFNTKLEYIKRDAAMLAKYEIKSLNIAAFESLKQEYYATQKDPNMVARQKAETVKKDLLVERVYKKMVFLKGAFENSIDVSDLLSVTLAITNLSSKTDKELSVCARELYYFALEHKTVLSEEGISETFLSNFLIIVNEFSYKLHEINDSRATRTKQTRTRYEVENRVFKALKLICKTGRMVWFMEDNASMYKDYVLPVAYNKHKSANDKPIAIES